MFLTRSSFMPSFTCFVSSSPRSLHPQTLSNFHSSFCLIFSLLVPVPGRVPSNQCLPLVPVCMLPCCRCHFLALYPCVCERESERGGGREMVRERKRQRERRGAKKKGKETRECMQMQSPSRLQICKCCCLCDMQMRDYRALIRVKRTVHVN